MLEVSCRVLSVRLARLACHLDDLTLAIADTPSTGGDLLLLAAPALHLSIAVERLERLMVKLELHGQSPPVETLASAA